MPRAGDLSKCKIYKITSLNNPDLVSYGHTCQTLAQRFSSHKAPHNPTKSKQIIEKGDAIILLVEEFPCESEDQAKVREAFYILNNTCVNKQVPGRTHKDSMKCYFMNNKDKWNEYQREYKRQQRLKINNLV